MSRFAVCIPVLNGAAFIGQALESIAAQTLKDVRVIVSDNASSDGTPEILEAWSSRLDMKIVRQPSTLPVTENFNVLLSEIDCDAYMILCHDDYLLGSTALSQAYSVLTEHPEISAVYCDLLYMNERGRPLARRRFGREGAFDAEAAGRQTLRTVRNCFGIPLAIRRSALGELRYDDSFVYTMDVDLSWAISRSRPAWHIPEALIANRYSGLNTTWSLLEGTRREYLALAEKYGVRLDGLDRGRLTATCFAVAQQKRLFGAYERMTSWFN